MRIDSQRNWLWATAAILGLMFPFFASCGVGTVTDRPPQATPPSRHFVGLWITRWDTRDEAGVVEAIANASELGVTDVFWQVRGSADAYYAGAREPWGEWLLGEGSRRIPQYDPLAVALREAHAHGMRLHAWVNVMPLWRGKELPRDNSHALHTHPDWRMRNARGTPESLGDGYVIANPVLEDVHDHVVGVCKDIVSRYRVDGLHLDYIRFAPGLNDTPMGFPLDVATISQFERTVGPQDLQTPRGQSAFRGWIRDRITTLVRRIGREAKAVSPRIEYSAAVWRHPDIGRESYLQDGSRWLSEGIIDRAIPMIYTELESQVSQDWAAWRSATGTRQGQLTVGLGVYKHQAGETAEQLALTTGSNGICLFGYSSLYESTDPFQDRSAEASELRASRRASLQGLISGLRTLASYGTGIDSQDP